MLLLQQTMVTVNGSPRLLSDQSLPATEGNDQQVLFIMVMVMRNACGILLRRLRLFVALVLCHSCSNSLI